MANTWNQSGTTWGQNSYGLQTEVLVPITGLSTTSTVGSLDSSGPQQGWGAEAWGFENWGESATTVILTGVSATTSVGVPAAGADQGWGRTLWGEEPWGDSNNPVITLPSLISTSSLNIPTDFIKQEPG